MIVRVEVIMDNTRMTLSLTGFEMSDEDISKAADEELDAFSDFLQNNLRMDRMIPPERALLKTYIMLKLGVRMTK